MMFSQSLKIFSIFVVATCATAVAGAASVYGDSRIVNGQNITIDKAPYIVGIRLRGGPTRHKCGGTLITSQFAVTAAHCFTNRVKQQVIVVGNASTSSEKGERRFIKKLFIHPDYNEDTAHGDVAVLKLDRPMTANYTKPIGLCTEPLENAVLQVSGWGRLREGESEEPSEHLRTVRVPVMPQEECVAAHSNVRKKITDAMVCASGAGGKDACTGDSGGPALYGGSLCAIVSWGNGCGRTDYPGVYVRIDAVRDFIEDCLRK